MFRWLQLVAVGLLLASTRGAIHPGVSIAPRGLSLLPRTCTSTDIWPKGPGSALVPQAPASELQEMMSQIDPNRIESIITKLVSFGTRATCSNQTDPVRGIGAARDWLHAEMLSLVKDAHPSANITITVPSYIQDTDLENDIPFPTNISNVVATIQGSDHPNRVYVVSGHYDSRVTDLGNFVDDAPGADDDASGVAVVLELLRVFAQKPPPRATMVLMAVAGEEQGLFGSAFQAKLLNEAGADVQGMFTNDIVGASKSDNEGVVDPYSIRLFGQGIPSSENASVVSTRESIGGENDSPARELVRFVDEVATNNMTEMNVRVIYRTDRFLRGGDHEPFLDLGFPAARFTEPNEDFAHQHQDVRVDSSGMQWGDLIEFCDFDFIQRVAKVNGAAIWSLAQAPSTPRNVTIDTSVLTNNSTLIWNLDDDDGLDGYEVLWRPTIAPFWTNVIPVGLVDRTTVLLSKDNAIFGVRAVGKNGYKSPAAYPFPST